MHVIGDDFIELLEEIMLTMAPYLKKKSRIYN